MYLLMRFFDENELNTKVFKRTGEKYFSPIKEANDNLTNMTLENIEGAIAIYARKTQNNNLARKVKVTSVSIDNNSIIINIEPEQIMEASSGELQKCLYGLLKRKKILKNDNLNMPLLITLDDEDMDYINRNIMQIYNTKNIGDLTSLENYFKDSNWDAILKFFGPIDQVEKGFPNIWGDDNIISKLAFAASKYCATGIIPRELKGNSKMKGEFLKERTICRDQAEILFKRCIELDKFNARYYSNIGYFYYQNVMELTMPNGRRDGNVIEEINKAIKYFEQALKYDDKRIKDYYRKGYLLVSKLPQQLKFGLHDVASEKKDIDVKEIVLEGINCLDKVIELWESLDETETKDKKEKDRCYKEYVRSLYNRGKSFDDIFYNYWNEVFYKTLIYDKENMFEEVINISKKHIDYLKESKCSFEKCWIIEYPTEQGLENIQIEEVNKLCGSWVEEASDKLYRLGITYLNICWSIKDDKRYSQDKVYEYLNKSINLFNKAISVKISNNPMLKLKYISEKLARAYITKCDYNEAIRVLKNIKLGPADQYVINTLSLAYYLMKNYDNCIELLEPIARDKRNKVQLYSKLILGLSYYKLDKKDSALKIFNDIKSNIHDKDAKINDYIEKCKRKR